MYMLSDEQQSALLILRVQYDSTETKLCTKDHTEPKTSYIIRR
ncbi:hypothetical protein PROFUN_16916 [Planoprotostelium fungivorum]|uniref:Uncharacterized protein n=1 Tax=Planoprotostelium fungivorum TaxID=1890364 RepID=A0A2P6MNE6_9EUKA|nr:hypothetical protein PROFUN_16916 [Planoprotostelium fungivorum]